MWLRGRIPFTRHAALWDRFLLYRPHRHARYAIEDVSKSLLGHLCDGLDPPAVDHDIDEIRCCGRIPIPESVMNELEVPDQLARLRVEAHDAVFEETVPRTLSTIEIGCLRLHRD